MYMNHKHIYIYMNIHIHIYIYTFYTYNPCIYIYIYIARMPFGPGAVRGAPADVDAIGPGTVCRATAAAVGPGAVHRSWGGSYAWGGEGYI